MPLFKGSERLRVTCSQPGTEVGEKAMKSKISSVKIVNMCGGGRGDELLPKA